MKDEKFKVSLLCLIESYFIGCTDLREIIKISKKVHIFWHSMKILSVFFFLSLSLFLCFNAQMWSALGGHNAAFLSVPEG